MQTTATNTKSKYRFNIKSKLAELDEDEKNRIKLAVKEEFKIHRSTMTRYLNERRTQVPSHMPSVVLQSFARHLGTHMEDLLNK